MDNDGWLHTGDLARQDEDGYFFIVGRSKELIIKGGVNIAPRQIDEVLESHPSVLEAAAIGVPDRYFGEDVVAFVVLAVRDHSGREAAACLLRKSARPFQISVANPLPERVAERPFRQGATAPASRSGRSCGRCGNHSAGKRGCHHQR